MRVQQAELVHHADAGPAPGARFHSSARAPVLSELQAALAGRSLADHQHTVEHPLEVLYPTMTIPRSLLSFFATEERRADFRYALGEHGPHQYVSALRPSDRVSEFGD